MLAIWDDGAWQDATRIAVILVVAYLVVMWIAALVWTYRDIASRTRDQFTHAFSVLLVAAFNLPGLILYLILRPKDTLADTYDRQLEAEALLQELQEQATCPSCRRKVSEDFISCPYCRSGLRVPCERCDRALAFGWVVCPYCGAERGDQVLTRPAAVPVAKNPPATATAPASPQTPASSPQPPAPRLQTPDTSPAARSRRANTAKYTPPARQAPADAIPTDAPEPGS